MSRIETPEDLRDAVRGAAEKASSRVAETAEKASSRVAETAESAEAKAREKLRPAIDARVKAQLARTSRQLAREAGDLEQAIESLGEVIEGNRRDGARGRTRLIIGMVAGAALAYHLDPAHGRERRAIMAERIKRRS